MHSTNAGHHGQPRILAQTTYSDSKGSFYYSLDIIDYTRGTAEILFKFIINPKWTERLRYDVVVYIQ